MSYKYYIKKIHLTALSIHVSQSSPLKFIKNFRHPPPLLGLGTTFLDLPRNLSDVSLPSPYTQSRNLLVYRSSTCFTTYTIS